MNKTLRLTLLLFLALAISAPAATNRFDKEIAAFEAADKTNPPPKNAILFIGSSSIRKWTTLAKDFPDHKVFNRGFGGSELSDSVYFFDRIVLPYQPKMIVLYAGSNDINAGKSPETVFNDFKQFAEKIRAELPGAILAFISINTSPARWKDVEKVKRANALISDYIATDDKMAFINTFSAMFDSDGKPRPELYVADRLHMNARGYAIWTSLVAPCLTRGD